VLIKISRKMIEVRKIIFMIPIVKNNIRFLISRLFSIY
jgi:hypothetical protein